MVAVPSHATAAFGTPFVFLEETREDGTTLPCVLHRDHIVRIEATAQAGEASFADGCRVTLVDGSTKVFAARWTKALMRHLDLRHICE